MTTRFSTGLTNFLANGGGLVEALNNGVMEIYSGAQPSSGDAAPTGTLLCTVSDTSAAHTPEVLATGSMTLTGGAAGSVSSVTVGGVEILGATVPFNGTLAQTATDVATQINRHIGVPNYTAAAVGAVITITALPNSGASANGLAVTSTNTTITSTYVNMAGGVNAANGLKFDAPVAGVFAPRTGQVWSGNNVNGTQLVAGWFRFYPATGASADGHALDSTGVKLRMDGAVSTTGAELNLNNTTFAPGAPTKISGGTVTMPSQ